jgi:DNA/RNA-binding domain of Phe-tRNA-synthetase-like protein
MLSISATDEWQNAHPGAVIGLLELSSVFNTQPPPQFEEHKRAIEAGLRARYRDFSRPDFLGLPVMSAYASYYKRFDKTYHVLLQLESLVLKGKDLPDVSPLVDANFMAEVETLVLTAGHDIAKLQEPVVIDVSREGEHMIQMNGTSKAIRAGDMLMRDAKAISCSILYGQDNRSPISPATAHVLYVAYAPSEVPGEAVQAQLRKIEEYVRLFSPAAVLEQRRLISA